MNHNDKDQASGPIGPADADYDFSGDSPKARLTDNMAALADLDADTEGGSEEYVYSARARDFYRFMRRHESNVFNAIFFDKENITEEMIRERVGLAAGFFALPVPEVIGRCDGLAQIVFTDSRELPGEIRYDAAKLEATGINNADAFDAMLTHELSHQFLAGKGFDYCLSRNWCMELACDFLVGARCCLGHLASGKYKYAVGRMKPTESHPEGRFRSEAVEAGFGFAERLAARSVRTTAANLLPGIVRFLITRSKALNRSYMDMLAAPPEAPRGELDIDSLPDTNLLKQYYLKHKMK